MKELLTNDEVHAAIKTFGIYRTRRIHAVLGPHLAELALTIGLRETGLRNIEGGAIIQDGKWIFAPLDVGWCQISRTYNKDALLKMPGVKAGTWSPVVAGKTAADTGYCPRFEEATQFVKTEFHENRAWCMDNGVKGVDRDRITCAAHNCGLGNAIDGWKKGNIDLHTAHGDYSAWCVAMLPAVTQFFTEHPGWADPTQEDQ